MVGWLVDWLVGCFLGGLFVVVAVFMLLGFFCFGFFIFGIFLVCVFWFLFFFFRILALGVLLEQLRKVRSVRTSNGEVATDWS